MKVNYPYEYKIVDQRYDGFEIWLRRKEGSWFRMDAMLEYFISGVVVLSYGEKFDYKDRSQTLKYGEKFFKKFMEVTKDGEVFDLEIYKNWSKEEIPNSIDEAQKVFKHWYENPLSLENSPMNVFVS
jgi:hypothetical protein